MTHDDLVGESVITFPTAAKSDSNRTSFRLGDIASEWVALALLIVGGIAAGIAAKTADELNWSWIGDLGTFPALWVLVLALLARFAPSALSAAARASSFFTSFCLAYYGWSVMVLGFAIDRNLWLWTGLALTVVPLLAGVTNWATKRSGLFPAMILAAVAALAVVDGIVWQLWWTWGGTGAPEGFPLRPIQAFANLAAAGLIVGLLPRDNRTLVLVLAMLVPVAIVIARLVDFFMGNLLRMI